MLYLILANRNQLGSIQQDVGCLQNRIIQQAGRNALLAARLFLELSLPLELTQRRDSVEYPG